MFVNDGRREAGYGVIELVVVVSMAVVITTLALVGFSKGRARYALRQNANNLTSQIERARSIAIKMNQTLTLGFSSDGTTFGLTCSDCLEAKDELKAMTLPADLTLSAFPTISVRGNGTLTVQGSTGSLTLTDESGRSVDVNLNNSGRVVVGDVTDQGTVRSGRDTTAGTSRAK
jgi:Tfp pilus assembly protein FimT